MSIDIISPLAANKPAADQISGNVGVVLLSGGVSSTIVGLNIGLTMADAILGGIIVVIGGAVLLGIWRYRWDPWPFKMIVTDREFGPLLSCRTLILGIDSQNINFTISPRQQQQFEKFNVSFVEAVLSFRAWKSLFYVFTPLNVKKAHIDNINHADRPEFPDYETTIYKNTASADLQFECPLFRSTGDKLFVSVNAICFKSWKGYIQFEAYNANGNRRTARLRVTCA